MSERWRCFVAIPLAEHLRDELTALVDRWRAEFASADLRWTDPTSWHVTLAFLGDVTPADVPALAARLPELARGPVGRLTASAVVAWPRAHETRLVWCRFGAEPALLELHRRVAGGLAVTERRRYRPHITLARVPGSRPVDIGPFAVELTAPGGGQPVDRIVLYRSHLAPGGAAYEPLATVPCGMMVA
jgi:RNA 2',3'-cyclic 3'-phosphodiesterase